MPELFVLEVVSADLDRPALRLKLPADRLEIADQFALLSVHADHRLPSRDRRGDRLVDVRKLRVAIGMLSTLARLLVRLQAVALGLQQPQHRAIDDLVAHRSQRLREPRAALRRPPQRRLRIPTGDRIDQPIQRLTQPSFSLQDPRPPSPGPTHPLGLQLLLGIELPKPPPDRRFRDPRRARHRRDSPTPVRPRLSRRPPPPRPLVQQPPHRPVPLTDSALIDHARPLPRQHPKPSTNLVVDP
jgi:hypothetical protein